MKWEAFRNDVRSRMESRGKTQLQVCEETDINPSTLCRFLGGDRIGVEVMERLADWMRASLDDYRGDPAFNLRLRLLEGAERIEQQAKRIGNQDQRPLRDAVLGIAKTLKEMLTYDI